MAMYVPSGAPVLATPTLPVPLVPSRQLYAGRPALAVQGPVTPAGIVSMARIGAPSELGAVLTFAPGRAPEEHRIRPVLAIYRASAGDVSHALVDANRYAGKRRVSGVSPLSIDWIDAQLRNGQRYALTDSPYIPFGDTAALRSTLAQGRDMRRPVVVNLPISYRWLKERSAELLEAINSAGVPVALTIEHAADPMGVQAAVRGLVNVLAADQPVLVLRCDASAIAAVAYGAAGGAIGTATRFRHLYPMPKPDAKGGGRSARIAVWVPHLLAYMSLERVSDLAPHPDVDQYFRCLCTLCNGDRLDRVVDETQAWEHSLHALTDFATTKVAPAKSVALQRFALFEAGERAQFAHMDIADVTGVDVEPPAFIGAWRAIYRASAGV